MVASPGDDLDPVVVLIGDREPTPGTFNEWLSVVAQIEPLDIGISAVELIAEARAHGEV